MQRHLSCLTLSEAANRIGLQAPRPFSSLSFAAVLCIPIEQMRWAIFTRGACHWLRYSVTVVLVLQFFPEATE